MDAPAIGAPRGSRQRRLRCADLAVTQVIVAKFTGDLRLLMASIKCLSFPDIGPLGEALTPPPVIFGYGMILGEIESNCTHTNLVISFFSCRYNTVNPLKIPVDKLNALTATNW